MKNVLNWVQLFLITIIIGLSVAILVKKSDSCDNESYNPCATICNESSDINTCMANCNRCTGPNCLMDPCDYTPNAGSKCGCTDGKNCSKQCVFGQCL